MGILRKLVLLALSVGVLLVMAAPASAVKVVQESTGAHCSQEVMENDVTGKIEMTTLPGQVECPVRGETAGHLELGGIFGAMVLCRVHLEGWASEVGEIVGTYTIETCEQNSAAACKAPDAHSALEILAGKSPTYTGEAQFCTIAFGLTIRCHVPVTINELAGHNYTAVFKHTTPCENSASNSLDGTITLISDAAHPKIELKD